MRVFYLCHPIAGDTRGNLLRGKRWLRWFLDALPDAVVIAPWIHDLEALPLRDSVPLERERSLQRCVAVARRCTGALLVARITPGMVREASEVYYTGGGVFDLTRLGEEPPIAAPSALLVGCDWSPRPGGPT